MAKDLVILVADKNTQFALKGAVARPTALSIRPIELSFLVHPDRDGGARSSGPEMLATQARNHRHALLIFDYEGCGWSGEPEVLEAELDGRLHAVWKARAKTVVIQPEVDAWMWGSENALRDIFGWSGQQGIRGWLEEKGYRIGSDGKPERPKEAMNLLCRSQRQQRSSSLYETIASRISLKSCTDRAFARVRSQLQAWFPCE